MLLKTGGGQFFPKLKTQKRPSTRAFIAKTTGHFSVIFYHLHGQKFSARGIKTALSGMVMKTVVLSNPVLERSLLIGEASNITSP